jgi:hypothetical protein
MFEETNQKIAKIIFCAKFKFIENHDGFKFEEIYRSMSRMLKKIFDNF